MNNQRLSTSYSPILRQGNEAKVYAASLGSMLAAYALLKRSRNGGREREPGPGRPGFWAGYKRAWRTLTAGLFKLAAWTA